jgi:hypothetical protein
MNGTIKVSLMMIKEEIYKMKGADPFVYFGCF